MEAEFIAECFAIALLGVLFGFVLGNLWNVIQYFWRWWK